MRLDKWTYGFECPETTREGTKLLKGLRQKSCCHESRNGGVASQVLQGIAVVIVAIFSYRGVSRIPGVWLGAKTRYVYISKQLLKVVCVLLILAMTLNILCYLLVKDKPKSITPQ